MPYGGIDDDAYTTTAWVYATDHNRFDTPITIPYIITATRHEEPSTLTTTITLSLNPPRASYIAVARIPIPPVSGDEAESSPYSSPSLTSSAEATTVEPYQSSDICLTINLTVAVSRDPRRVYNDLVVFIVEFRQVRSIDELTDPDKAQIKHISDRLTTLTVKPIAKQYTASFADLLIRLTTNNNLDAKPLISEALH
ncbi:MAG: hypothetical protein MMC23_002932, partial [Stictis urceolatum]|nr:hypothetical protein [Stictis urceolata]